MTRLLVTAASAAMLTAVLGCGPASAQFGGTSSAPAPLGITSPLGIGPAPAVPGTGLPLGTTELNSAGVSPMASGVFPLGPAALGINTCSHIESMAGSLSGTSPMTGSSVGTGVSTSGTSVSSTVFDGGGNVGTASGTCASSIASTSGQPAASASSPTGMASPAASGRIGIPMGSTELGVGGLSPMPQILNPNFSTPSATVGTPCSTTGTATMGTTMSGTLSGSC